ncbi:MAG: T9SS type A sorting domain-containing protein [Ignavibacteriae bacterium]|nr:T9SS type A sorting domain-containing protein [Ignavibacteriota bacterium]
MKKNLHEYFDSANRFLDSQNLMSQAQLQTLVESKPIIPSGKLIKLSNKFIQRGVIMSITGVAVLIGLYFGSGLFNANEPAQKGTNKTQLISQSQSLNSGKNLTLNKSEEKAYKDYSHLNPPESFHNIVPIIRLNPDELKNLGFVKTDSGYTLITETPIKEELDPQKIKMLPYFGYNVVDSTLTFKEKFTIDTFKSKMDVIPYKESKSYGNVKLNPIVFHRHYKSKNGYGFTGQGLSDANNIEKEALRKVFPEMDRFKNQYIFQGKLDEQISDFVDVSDSGYSYITKLIPIYFTLGNPKENGSENIIWYVASKKLINSLPDRYKNILKDNITYVNKIEPTKKDKELYAPIKNVKEDIYKADSIKALTLSIEELKRIGIGFIGYNFKVLCEEINNDKQYSRLEVISDKTGNFSMTPITFDSIKNPSPLKIAPVAITSYSLFYEYIEKIKEFEKSEVNQLITMEKSPLLSLNENKMDINKEFKLSDFGWTLPTLKKLVPVKISVDRFDNKDSSKIVHFVAILWYVPTKEFIEALPDRYQKSITTQLELLDQIEKGAITEDKACETLKGKDSYFDICRLSSDNIKNLSVYPNPITNNSFNLKFNLLKKTKLEFDLFDINGSHKAHLLSTTLEPGAIDIPNKLNAPIEDGIYIIIIKSGDGSQVATRVIIQNR